MANFTIDNLTGRILQEANKESPEAINLYLIGREVFCLPNFRNKLSAYANGPDAAQSKTGKATAAAFVNALFMRHKGTEVADTLTLFNTRALETLAAGNPVGFTLHRKLIDAYIMSDSTKGPVYPCVFENHWGQRPAMYGGMIPINPLFVMRETVRVLRNSFVDGITRQKFVPVFMESLYPAMEQSKCDHQLGRCALSQSLGFLADAALFCPLPKKEHGNVVQLWRTTLIEVAKEHEGFASEIFYRAKMKTSGRDSIVQDTDKRMGRLNLKFVDYLEEAASKYYNGTGRMKIGNVLEKLDYTS